MQSGQSGTVPCLHRGEGVRSVCFAEPRSQAINCSESVKNNKIEHELYFDGHKIHFGLCLYLGSREGRCGPFTWIPPQVSGPCSARPAAWQGAGLLQEEKPLRSGSGGPMWRFQWKCRVAQALVLPRGARAGASASPWSREEPGRVCLDKASVKPVTTSRAADTERCAGLSPALQ